MGGKLSCQAFPANFPLTPRGFVGIFHRLNGTVLYAILFTHNRSATIVSFKVINLCFVFPYARADLQNQGISQVTKVEI